ncbi:hypothetical protein A3J56_00115 [Candidatus Giovannonibacteria bacterium RIFCSPHIGHO2_02_FULL_46_20]|uniref:Uncharacterized protein n=1 Tax=Candidatus Giovannonibacteria bacterium RIFCSPHIGHO2_02_FULL_46_20 TaxID=1798338 RepID=A0A1F5WDI4_9BACT|nr:MAG: hypothetical protein A3J56_00115 [Candidatus Giovannonibacteria bacterium RIFCSPHIGHO2_02_FULL_46_20]
MSNISNRVFAFIFFAIVLLLLLWMPTWTKINLGDVPSISYSPPWIGFLIILIGLAYEIFRPSLNLKRDASWKWMLAGGFLLLIILIMVIVQEVWLPYKQGYSIFGMRSFEFPAGSSNISVWPQLLWDLLNVHSTDTTVLALLFGTLFLTRSTPQTSKSYKLILIGAIIFTAFLMLGHFSFLIFNIDPTGGYYSRFTRIELLSQYWFQWDFWSESVILVGALWLLLKGKKVAINTN